MALNKVKAIVKDEMKPPFAHIKYSKNGKKYGQHKGHLKSYRIPRKSIYLR